MRANGYKCYQTKCGCCVGNVCAEPFDIALGCSSRLVNLQTNADRIRAMSDEELCEMLTSGTGGFDCGTCRDSNACDRECELHCAEWLKQPVKDGEDE